MTGFLNVENETTARHPSDVRYMKMIRFLLRMVCAWPQQLLGEEVTSIPLRNTCFLFVEGLGCGIGGLVYVRMHYNKVSFLELGHTYTTVFLSTVATQRVTIPWFKSYRNMMKEFVLELHLFHHRQKTAFNEYVKMYQYIHRICTVFVTVLYTELFCGVFLFNLGPLYSNYAKGMFGQEMPASGKFEHSINYYIPYIHHHSELTGYIFIATVNLLFSFDAGVFFIAYDLIICVIVLHIWGHLKIMNHNLRSIPTPIEMRDMKPGRDELSYTKEENKKVANLLKNIILHHRMISSFMSKTSEAFGPTLCLYYMFHQVSGCILLLEVAELDAQSLTRYGSLTLTVFQLLIQLSVIVELLGSQSETLKDAVYSVPWEYMDTSNRKIVLFLLCNVQEPIRLKPLGLVSVGVQTMASILKTSFSYFMLLRTFT